MKKAHGWQPVGGPFGVSRPRVATRGLGSALRELEALAGALAAVFLAFLHAAVAGQVAGIAQLLGHVVDRLAVHGFGRGGQAVHLLQGPRDALADGPALAAD